MGRWAPLVVFLPIGAVLVLGGHYYLWERLVRDVEFSAPLGDKLKWAVCALGASIPIGVITSRFTPTRWSRWWVTPVYLWIGLSYLLLLSLAGIDLLRLLSRAADYVSQATAEHQLARVRAVIAISLASGASVWGIREAQQFRVARVEIPLSIL